MKRTASRSTIPIVRLIRPIQGDGFEAQSIKRSGMKRTASRSTIPIVRLIRPIQGDGFEAQ